MKHLPQSVAKELSCLLVAWNNGDETARDAISALMYDELRRRASIQRARERPEFTLDATELAHEAYLRLSRPQGG